MDMYISAMDKIGDAIISAIDPDSSFTGYTKVRKDRIDFANHTL
jgi:hypothetical protein